ncbi:unnamed protein product [Protopolystoma xenopodis]|uniref:Uncharacterized protein n=1 Tax=Protopolystoma xenopodis TaxID=117903 RepID=A0A3S4ZT50_9PLAT|nr:unnamed protein product [Protopolystoma xenopodis]
MTPNDQQFREPGLAAGPGNLFCVGQSDLGLTTVSTRAEETSSWPRRSEKEKDSDAGKEIIGQTVRGGSLQEAKQYRFRSGRCDKPTCHVQTSGQRGISSRPSNGLRHSRPSCAHCHATSPRIVRSEVNHFQGFACLVSQSVYFDCQNCQVRQAHIKAPTLISFAVSSARDHQQLSAEEMNE